MARFTLMWYLTVIVAICAAKPYSAYDEDLDNSGMIFSIMGRFLQ